jgi:hypothetical protein
MKQTNDHGAACAPPACLLGWLGSRGWLSAMRRTRSTVTSSLQGGVEVVRIDFSQPLDRAAGRLRDPVAGAHRARLSGRDQRHGPLAIEVNQGNLRSVNVVQAGDRTRLVLNLKQADNYKAEMQGKSLLVSLEPVAGRPVRRRPRRSSPRTATATPSRCATSTSAAAPTVPAA